MNTTKDETMKTNTRKTILLRANYELPSEPARRYIVLAESERTMEVTRRGELYHTATLVKQPDGTLTNQHGNVRFTVMKPDRRPKPYAVLYRGIDGRVTRRFATVAEAAQYVWERWQGVEYMDSPHSFHTDYAAYETVGFALADIFEIDRANWSAVRKEVLS